MSGRRRVDHGFTLVELVISMVLAMIIAGVTVSAMLTSMNAADSTVEQIEDSTDATLVSAYLIRDAQAAGGVDPRTGTAATDVGVSIAASTAGWQGCQQTGTLVVRFSWYDRESTTSAEPVVVTYALGGDGSLTRRVCERGTVVDLQIGSHVSAASASCAPNANCTGQPTSVSLAVTGSGVRSPFSYSLTASLRGDVQATPTTTNSAPVPLMALGSATSACPNLTISATASGTGTITVLGDAIVGDDCGSSPVAGDQTKLQPTGATSLVHALADPYASVAAPTSSCPAPGTVPGVNPTTGSASSTGVTVYPSAVAIGEFDVVTFEAGIHVFCDGVTVASGATVSGTDVLWYVAGGNATIAGGSQVELAAATSGTWSNLVLWQAGSGTTATIDAATRVPTLRGVVYAPAAHVDLTGSSPMNLGGVVARSVATATASSVRLGMPIPYLQISPTTVPAAQSGVAYGPVQLAASGGTGTLTWSATGLPAGMTLSPEGALGGNPTVLGRFDVVVTVVDDTAAARSTTYRLDVRPPLAITAPTSLAAGQVGVVHAGAAAAATGGLAPYSWTATGLPAGIQIDSAGVVSGTPTQAGSFSVVITVSDAGGGVAATTLPLTISAALSVTSPASLPSGTTGTAYTATTITAGGGTSPYSITATGLPPGLTFTPNGVVSGTPTMGGTFEVVVTVADAAGAHATRTYQVQITAATSPILPMGAAQGFQVLTEQNAGVSSSGVQGAVAVGGNLSFGSTQTFGSSASSTFRPVASGSYTTLAVGGLVSFDSSPSPSVLTVSNGFLHVGSASGATTVLSGAQAHLVPSSTPSATATPRITVSSGQTEQNAYPFVASPAFPFTSAFSQFRARSGELAVLGPSTCSSIASAAATAVVGGHTLGLTAGKVNVWTTTVAEITGITSLSSGVTVTGTAPLVINVTDAGAVSLPSKSWAVLTAATKSAVIWNFPNATSLSTTGTFAGTLYAPSAAVTLSSIALTGDVVAKSLTVSSGTLDLAHFTASIPCGSPALAIPLPASLPAATRGVASTATTMTGTGGVPGYSWSATGLPAGMSMSSAGVLSGTPTTSGTSTVTVTVTDALAATASRTYTLVVADAPTVASPAALPNATVNVSYPSQAFTATGGSSPYTWSATGLPAGMSMSSAGVLSGTPTATGSSTVAVTVTDAAGRVATATRALVVQTVSDAAGCPNAPVGWKAEYFNNRTLSGVPTLCRDDAAIDFDWADRAPATTLPRDYFSVRWTRTAWYAAGTYSFEKGSDDGMRVYVDGTALIDDWVDHSYDGGRWYRTSTLTAGYHTIVVEFYERGGLARAWFHLEQEVAATCPASVTGWRGEYFRTRDLTGVVKVCRDDSVIDFDWASSSPGTGVPADDFSVRWTKTATFDEGLYTFTKGSDDGMRVYVDGVAIIDDWREHSYDGHYTASRSLTAGTHTVVVEFYERGGLARATFSWLKVASATCPSTITGWKGEYYSNTTLSGSPVMCRDDPSLSFNWGNGSPVAGMPSDNFSVRWTKTAYFSGGTYTFTFGTDDGVRIWFDGYLSVDWWSDRSYYPYSGTYNITAGWHTIKVEYYEHGGTAQVTLVW